VEPPDQWNKQFQIDHHLTSPSRTTLAGVMVGFQVTLPLAHQSSGFMAALEPYLNHQLSQLSRLPVSTDKP